LRWPLTTLLLPPATRHSPLFQAVSVRSIWGEPGRTANRQAFPNSPYPAISHSLQDRQIERISFRVSTNTHRAPLRGLSEARAFTSYRIGKDHRHDPDILSLRHDCPTLAAVSGKWFPLDGRSAIATGWFPSLSDGVRGPSHPPGGCSLTRPPTCCVTRPRAWSQASILNRFASSLAGADAERQSQLRRLESVPQQPGFLIDLCPYGVLRLKTGLNKVIGRNLIPWV